MQLYFSADYHLGHFNIIEYCKRPFKSLKHMINSIIKNHNSRVKKEDLMFHIGDFCFRNSPGGKKGEGTTTKAKDYQKRLNGNIIYIRGNHDKSNSLKTPIEKIVIRHGGKRINMVHNPIHADPTIELNLVGHVHNAWKIKRLNDNSIMYNVGLDVNHFKPVTFDEIVKNISKWKKNGEKDEFQRKA